jgi:hypothetical protein
MSVVLRCPNCGTTQAHPGECEACAEGEVQYFCTNHDEGIWLDGPVCRRCGAKFGDAPARPTPVSPPPVSPPPAGPPDFRARTRGRTHERSAEPDFGSRPARRTDSDEVAEPEVLPPAPTLGDLLEEITGGRARRRVPSEVDDTSWAGAPRGVAGFPLAGCLLRILGLGVFLILAFVLFLFLLFGGLLGR